MKKENVDVEREAVEVKLLESNTRDMVTMCNVIGAFFLFIGLLMLLLCNIGPNRTFTIANKAWYAMILCGLGMLGFSLFKTFSPNDLITGCNQCIVKSYADFIAFCNKESNKIYVEAFVFFLVLCFSISIILSMN